MACRSLRIRFFGFSTVAAYAVLLLLSPNPAQAQGVSRNWTDGGVTDNWFDPVNWSPLAVPDATDFLSISFFSAGLNANNIDISGGGRIDVGNTANVTLNTLDVGDFGQGTLSISDGAQMTINAATLGNNGPGNGTVNVGGLSSVLTINGPVIVGNVGWGSLNIDAGNVSSSAGTVGSDFSSVGRVAVDFGGTWAVSNDLYLGFAGAGELDIRAGSQITVGGNAMLADDISGNGRAYVRGVGALWDVAGDLTLADKGSATIEVTDGGTLANTAARLATNTVGSATVLVDGIGSIWDNSGTLTIGEWGQGSIIVSAGAAVENTSATLGEFQDGSAEVTITGAGSRWTNSGAVRIGDDGDAVLNVLDGAAFSSAAADIAYQDGSTATVTADGVGTTWTSTGSLIAGRSGVGTFNITGGAVVSSPSGVVSLSVSSAGSIAVVDGAGSRWEVASGVQVGSGGSGTLNVLNGGTVTNASMVIANGTGSTGAVTVSGVGSLVTVGSNLLVGNAGTGEMTIDTGGATTVGGTTDIGPLGTLTINGGSLTTTSLDNTSGGTFTFTDGTVTVDGGVFNPGGSFSLNGTSTSTLNLKGAGSSSFNNLNVGSTGNATLNVTGGFQLTAADTVIGATGEIVLDGGTLLTDGFTNNSGGTFTFRSGTLTLNGDVYSSNSPLTLPSSGTLSGNGFVSSEINGQFGSTIAAIDGGLTLGDSTSFFGFIHEGTLDVGAESVNLLSRGFAQLGPLTTLLDGTLTSTRGVVLGIGDNLTGRGEVNTRVAAGFGSTIRASGDLSLGDSSSPIGFSSNGVLEIFASTVTLNDSNAVDLGTLTTIGFPGLPPFVGPLPGTLIAANGVNLDFGDNITGYGTVQSPNDPAKPFINNGDIAGNSLTNPITLTGYVKGVGTLDNVIITGTDAPGFSPAAVNRGSVIYDGTLEIELGGLNPGSEFDQLIHVLGAGLADLGGVLDVQFISGFTPSAGDTFEIITATNVVDTFDTLNLPALPGDLLWFVNYGATSVELVSTYSADFDEDGDVDGDDLAAWEGGFGSTAATHSDGDANANALTDGFDFLTWQRQLTNGGTLSAASTTVPEPTTGCMLLMGLTVVVLARRQDKRSREA
ncbi:MAG: PEP-CTERM sorting domain-containing protein [Planctomycetes bacterium]|nr:PEP-CTERM sorting domain-containing protein [Planctomycetota bacterium]